MRQNYLLGLTPSAVNILAGAIAIAIVLGGIRIYQAASLSFATRDTQLLLGGTASQLKDTAADLGAKSELIAEKEQKIDELIDIYELSLKNQQGFERLKNRIEALEQSPKIEGIEELQQKIVETEANLSKIGEY